MVILSWVILIVQLFALFLVVRNVPALIVRMCQSVRNNDLNPDWYDDPFYIGIVISVMVLVFFGLPKFA